MRILALLACLATPAMAQEGLRASDQTLSASEMTDLLSGQMIEFYDGSKSRYAVDGAYSYTYTDDDPPWTGDYQLFDDSRVCVDFHNGSRRCDLFVRDGERTVLITQDGLRFPVRNRTVYQR